MQQVHSAAAGGLNDKKSASHYTLPELVEKLTTARCPPWSPKSDHWTPFHAMLASPGLCHLIRCMGAYYIYTIFTIGFDWQASSPLATWELVDQVTGDSKLEKNKAFEQSFLLSYPTFATPLEIFSATRARYVHVS